MAINTAPYLGEIRTSKELGRKGAGFCIWAACLDCGKERWVRYSMCRARPSASFCRPCGGRQNTARREASPAWKGGRHKEGHGYIVVFLSEDDFFYPMARKDGYVLEHRLVMAQHLGRCLQRWEIVHHKNHKRVDNRIENLQLVSDERHKQITILERRIKLLEKRVTLLEGENTLLKAWQLF